MKKVRIEEVTVRWNEEFAKNLWVEMEAKYGEVVFYNNKHYIVVEEQKEEEQ
jgi:hypothetical protein